MWEKVCTSVKVPRLAKALRSAGVPKLDKEYMSGKEYMSVRVLQESHFAWLIPSVALMT